MDEFDRRTNHEPSRELFERAGTSLGQPGLTSSPGGPQEPEVAAHTAASGSFEPARPWIIGALACLIVGAFTFIGGWWLGRETGQREILPNSSAMRGSGPTQVISGTTSPEDLREQFQLYWDVWDLVAQEFYHEGPVDQQKMIYASIRGMLEALDDPYTSFQEPEIAEHAREEIQGNFDGIGATVEFKDGELTIIAPIPETPADKAGLKSGDQILEVDGKDMSEALKDLSTQEATAEGAQMIRGPKGSKVRLKIYRPETDETKDYELERAEIPLISVRSELIDGYAHIRVSQFSAPTAVQLDRELQKALDAGAKGIILDLRDNPGGLVDTAQEIMGRFVEEGVMMHWRYADGTMKESKIKREKGEAVTVYDLPMIVLVNGGSASASEIVAGALRDYNRAKLLGEKTFGKGSVQNVRELRDKSSARITVARWLTPNKQEIHEKGIMPELVVPDSGDPAQYPVPCAAQKQPPEGFETCGDAQLFWALKVLRGEGNPPPTATPDPRTPTVEPGE